MKKTILIAGALAAPLLLAGCSNTQGTDKINTKLDALSEQVSALQAEQSTLSNDVSAAKAEAQRANQRIDHIAKSYTK